MIVLVVFGWLFIGVSLICFVMGARSLVEADILRNEAGDIELWGLRKPISWLKKAGVSSELVELVKKRAKKRSGVPNTSLAHPHNRRPLTSLRRQLKPRTGRFGCIE